MYISSFQYGNCLLAVSISEIASSSRFHMQNTVFKYVRLDTKSKDTILIVRLSLVKTLVDFKRSNPSFFPSKRPRLIFDEVN